METMMPIITNFDELKRLHDKACQYRAGSKEWIEFATTLKDSFPFLYKTAQQMNEELALLRSLVPPEWPHGATVKLRYVGWQYDPNSKDFGWAKRDAEGNLITVYGGSPLDADSWEVIEERCGRIYGGYCCDLPAGSHCPDCKAIHDFPEGA